MKSPLVSVIIPTKNSNETLLSCIKSVRQQTYSNVEIIVVDNDSSDDTPEIAKQHADKFYKKGPERSAQRNFGANKSNGKYLAIIDSDMELSNKVIESCVAITSSNDSIKAVVIPEASFGEGFWSQCKKLERSFYVGVSWMEAARFFPKEVFEEFGGYNEKNTGTEDYDLPQRISYKYGAATIINSPEYILHNEKHLSLIASCKKKFYYAQGLKQYSSNSANVANFHKQSSALHRYGLFFSKPKLLFKNPVYGIGMLFMKTCELNAALLGYLHARSR